MAPEDPAAGVEAAPRWLGDVVVLDLGDEATALAGALLAELGAEVIRVEDIAGDALRRPERGPLANAVFNAGKRSIAIDTSTDAGWEPVRGLVDGIDVVIGPIEPNEATARFVASVVDRLSTDPWLGVVEVVFGRGGPVEPTTDLTATAAGGLTWLCGDSEDPPNQPAGDLGWKQTSLTAAEAALGLITAQRRSGRGGHVVVSAQEAVALTTLQTANGNIGHWHGIVPDRHAKLAANTTFLSADGQWTSFTIHPPNWAHFVDWAEEVIGGTGLDGPEWLDLDYVGANRGRVADVVRTLVARFDRDQLIAEGQARGLLVLPVNTLADVVADHHLDARGFWVDVAGTRLAGSPFRSSLGRAARLPAPGLGADQQLVDDLGPRCRVERGVATPDARQPLAGVRIVDFSWAIAGSLATRLLADLGADVIKLESNNRTDPIRYIGPQPPGQQSVDTNGVFNDCSANKRAVTLNVDTEEGRQIARQLIATADVVAANYTPDRLDRWGFDYETLDELRPGMVVANLAVMGTWGPDAGWRSYGSGIVAMCGLAAHTGFDGRPPECLGTLHTDFTVPYFAAMQILAALHHRDRTGQGAYLELAQYETAVRLLDEEVAGVLNGGPLPGRLSNRSPRAEPHGVFPAAGDDRWVAIAARCDDERRALASVIGEEANEEAVARWTQSRSRNEVVEVLRGVGVPVCAVKDLGDHRADPEMASLWADVDLPAGVNARVIHEPITWDGERLPVRAAPMWFEHTYEVLVDELGLDIEDFARLVETGVLS